MSFFSNCLKIVFVFIVMINLVGCSASTYKRRKPRSYMIPEVESEWILIGSPISFEEELWYPEDDIDILSDDEVYLLGEYNDTEFFVAKIDVRPYNRIYTKFEKNKFRVFEKKAND